MIEFMIQYIDKAKVAAEIENRIKETGSMQPKFDQFWAGQISAFKGILKILDTLEVKEIDLDALGVLAEHLIACDAHLVTPKYTDKELNLLEEWAVNNKAQKGE